MQTALRVTTRVKPGHKIEISAPELTEGEEVTVTVTSPAALAPSAPEARAALARHLLALGAIPAIPAGRSGPPPRLITVRGQAVSETIIEERGVACGDSLFDSSGLVKRYIAEVGSGWVQALNAPAAGHDRVIAQITGPEMIAAVTRRLRRGDTTPADAATAIAEIEADFAGDYFLLETSLARIREAMALARVHGLRGYDAVQLAAALFLCAQCRALGQPDPIFITADTELTAAAAREGLAVDDPNAHP